MRCSASRSSTTLRATTPGRPCGTQGVAENPIIMTVAVRRHRRRPERRRRRPDEVRQMKPSVSVCRAQRSRLFLTFGMSAARSSRRRPPKLAWFYNPTTSTSRRSHRRRASPGAGSRRSRRVWCVFVARSLLGVSGRLRRCSITMPTAATRRQEQPLHRQPRSSRRRKLLRRPPRGSSVTWCSASFVISLALAIFRPYIHADIGGVNGAAV